MQKERDELDKEWSRLSDRKPYAGVLIFAGAVVTIANIFETSGPTNYLLGAIALVALLAGGFWLWEIHREQDRILRRRSALRDQEGVR
jgi:hypothetical protein